MKMEFMTYRLVRLAMSAVIFVFAIFMVRAIRAIDLKTTAILHYTDRTLSHFYADRKARKSADLRIVDLNLTLADYDPTIKQACAQLIDSLRQYRARAIVVDLFFDPYVDTTGQAQLLQAARLCSNGVLGFAFRRESDGQLVGKLNQLDRHNLSYSPATNATVQNWPDYNLQDIELPIDGLAQAASRMGFVEVFPEMDGRIQFYPLFHRLAGVDSVFAGLSTQAFHLWIESHENPGPPRNWRLEDYFEYFDAYGIERDRDGRRLKIHRIPAPLQPDFAWQHVRGRQAGAAQFADKLVLIVNSPTETEGPLDEAGYPMWGYHASVISQMLDHSARQSTDLLVWPLLIALYAGWVYVKLWPSPITNQISQRRGWVWLGMAVFLAALPLFLPGQNFIANSPVSAALLMGMALSLFEAVERRLLRPPKIDFVELPLVLEVTAAGAAQMSIQQAPVRLGKRASYELPADKAKAWRNQQRASAIKDLPEMRRLGESLYDFLMAGEIGKVLQESLDYAERENKILRLCFRSESAAYDGLPFELLRNTVKDYGYLGLHSHLSIVRDLTADPSRELQWTLPIRLLVLMASPVGNGYGPLEVQAEKDKIVKSTRLLQRKGWLRLQVMDHITRSQLESLPPRSFDIIHFVGHGTIDEASRSNCLVFEGSAGEPDLVDAERLGQRLRQIGPGLILLNACATGEGIEKGAFVNVGRELQRTTGAAVIAQQYSISDLGGILLSDAFYKTFAETLSPELALNRARQIIAGAGDTLPSDWASPVYFIR
jgi:hypothetical protein